MKRVAVCELWEYLFFRCFRMLCYRKSWGNAFMGYLECKYESRTKNNDCVLYDPSQQYGRYRETDYIPFVQTFVVRGRPTRWH